MMATIALAVLAGIPAQPAELRFTNVRLTVGELGPARASTKLLPGDVLYIAFDVEGLTIDDRGGAEYTIEMEVVNSAGTRVLPPLDEPKPAPSRMTQFWPMGGNKVPCRPYVTIAMDQAAGTFTCKIAIVDVKSKAAGKLDVKFEVAKKEFGVVAVATSYDARGKIPAPPSGQVGQLIFVQFIIAAFERDAKTKEPDVEMKFQLFDDKGGATLKKPIELIQDPKSIASVEPIRESDARFAVLPFPVYMNRPGKFVLEITATDRVSKKTATYKLPITVLPAN